MKYIIEIENEPFGRNDDPVIPHGMDELYRAKGFKSLVFDKNGLDKLTPYTEPDRKAIEDAQEEAWEFAKQISIMNPVDKYELWGTSKYNTINLGYSYAEAKATYEAWKKQRDEVRVGDEVKIANTIGVVTRVPEHDEQRVHYITESGTVCCNNAYAEVKKTGRHFDEVEELLEKMRGEKE